MRTVRALTCILIAALAVTLIVGCGSNSDAKRNAAFSAKIAELESAYGTGEVITTDNFVYLAGLCYADLIEFGDGQQRLVTACLDRSKMQYSSPSLSNYVIEVWSWNGSSQEPLSCCPIPQISDVPIYGITYAAGDGIYGIKATSLAETPDGFPSLVYTYYGVVEDGSFGSRFVSDRLEDIPSSGTYTRYLCALSNQYSPAPDYIRNGILDTLESVVSTKAILAGEPVLSGTYALDGDKGTTLVVSDWAWAVFNGEETICSGRIEEKNYESLKPFEGAAYKFDYLFLLSDDGTLHMFSKTASGYELSAAKHILDGNPSLAADGTYKKSSDGISEDLRERLKSL